MVGCLIQDARHDQNADRSIRSENFFKANFLDRKTILLQDDRYQALVGLIGSPLTRQEIEGRKRLEKVPDWNL